MPRRSSWRGPSKPLHRGRCPGPMRSIAPIAFGCRRLAAVLSRFEGSSTNPTAFVVGIPSRTRRSSIAASRSPNALSATYVTHGVPRASSTTSVRRPPLETRQNSIGNRGPVGPKSPATPRPRGSQTSEPHASTAILTTPPRIRAIGPQTNSGRSDPSCSTLRMASAAGAHSAGAGYDGRVGGRRHPPARVRVDEPRP